MQARMKKGICARTAPYDEKTDAQARASDASREAIASKAVIPIAMAILVAVTLMACGAPRRGEANRPAETARSTAESTLVPSASGPDASGNRAPRVVSLAPATTSILIDIGGADLLVATDTWSTGLPGAPQGRPAFDMMKPDVEGLAALNPDILLVSAITEAGSGQNPFSRLEAAGITVIVMPTSADLQGVARDVERIAALVGREEAGRAVVAAMESAIAKIEAVAKTIPESQRRTVAFEIESAPWIYSFGHGVYLDDMLAKAGAVNAFGSERGWISVNAEAVFKADPDVILTNVATGDPVAEIVARPGWKALKAVRFGRVYRIDNMTSSQPAPACVRALAEIAKAVYPEYY